ncbi:MAG: hypothetical protein HYU24_11550 [Candidatus Rokubacteria bacterium]|nr:hypothetical protein [Candidatus Rokubacteria bacterium]
MVGVRGFARLPVVALVLVGAVLVACVAALAEAVSPMTRACGAVAGEELSASKAATPGLLAVPVGHEALGVELSPSGCAPRDLAPALFSLQVRGDLASRAPPILL